MNEQKIDQTEGQCFTCSTSDDALEEAGDASAPADPNPTLRQVMWGCGVR